MLQIAATDAHATNLDHLAGRSLRLAYLAIILAAARSGLVTAPRATGGSYELRLRDVEGLQHYTLGVAHDHLLFSLRRPALDESPELGGQARARFAERCIGGVDPTSEVHVRIACENDAEDLTDWLWGHAVNPGYGARRSA